MQIYENCGVHLNTVCPVPDTMLLRCYYFMLIEVHPYFRYNNVFKSRTRYGSKKDRSLVFCLGSCAYFVDGADCFLDPGLGELDLRV